MAQMDYQGNGNYLGVNAISGNTRAEWISYASRNAGYYLITPMQGLLRAPKEIWYSAFSNEDLQNAVYAVGYGNTYKSFYYTSGGFIYADFVTWADSWQPIGGDDEFGYYYLEDGAYTYRIDARIDGQDEYQTSTYPIFIDNELPTVIDHTYEVIDGVPTLTLRVTDNHYIMAAQLVDADYTKALSGIVAVEETELGAVTTLTFDLTEVQADGYKLCRLNLVDYAWNECVSDLISTVSQDIEPQVVQINEYAVTARADSNNMEMHAMVDPENAVNKTLTWSSTDESVAKVVAVSEDTMTAEIDFVGPGSCEIRATAVNGVYGAASVSVAKVESSWPSDNVIRQDGSYTIPADLNTTVTITDDAHNVWLTGAAANTQENPYQNLSIDSQNSELHLTIENLHLHNGANYSSANGIDFLGAGNTLTLVGENSVALADYGSYAGIHVPDGVALTLDGSGSLTILGNHNNYGAGIGSNAGEDAGKITINGGTYIIDHVFAGAAIGTGSGNAKATITINGGTFDIAMPEDNSGYNGNLAYCGAAIGTGNAASGGWSSPYKTMKITINGGDFKGYTNVDSPIIGVANGSGSLNAVININGGTFDLLTEDKNDSTMTGGACIGTGTQGYYGTFVPDITINGGEILAVSKSNGAAIGGGPGMDGGNLYIFGGTITAISESDADAIGAGTASPKQNNNVRIDGGSVKAVSTGTGMAFRDTTLLNDDSDAVFLVTLKAPNVTSVTVNGKDWHVSANHPGDDQLYLYLPSSETDHEVVVDGRTFFVTITPSGKVTVVEPEEPSQADKTELDAAIAAAEALNADDYTPATWEAVAEALENAQAVSADANADQAAVDAALAALNAAVAALAEKADMSELNAAIAAAEALNADDYTPATWAAVEEALENALAVSADANADQASVDAALADLNAAVAALTEKANKEDLLFTIQMAKGLNETKYTAESWAALEEALAAAEAVAADPNATQEQVIEASRNLNIACERLVRLGDMSALMDLYEEAFDMLELLERSVFPAELFNAFLQQFEDAEDFILVGGDRTQEEVDAMYNALQEAMDALDAYPVNNMYNDVPERKWYYDEIDFVTRYGFMNGMSGGFNPDGSVTRAQFVTVLYRIAGEPQVTIDNPFADVESGRFYTNAVLWAYDMGITTGVDSTHFDPNGTLVRQAMVTFLMRFADTIQIDTSARADLSGYTDEDQVSRYARTAMEWAVSEGIISGMTADTLAPAGVASRAQIATIISRFVPKYLW